MKVLGYIRVSTDEQARDGRSLEIQRQQLVRYCALYELELVDVVLDEGVSASTPLERRPGGARLLERLGSGAAAGVVIQRLDRMFRICLDGLQTFAWYDRRGITVHSVNEKIDTASPEGKMGLTLILAAAEYERNKIQQRAREVSAGLKASGRAWGPTPYGCVRIGDRIYRDPAAWALREEILAMREDLSLRAICAALRARGIPSPGGGRLWHISTVRALIVSHGELEGIPFAPGATEAGVSLGAAA